MKIKAVNELTELDKFVLAIKTKSYVVRELVNDAKEALRQMYRWKDMIIKMLPDLQTHGLKLEISDESILEQFAIFDFSLTVWGVMRIVLVLPLLWRIIQKIYREIFSSKDAKYEQIIKRIKKIHESLTEQNQNLLRAEDELLTFFSLVMGTIKQTELIDEQIIVQIRNSPSAIMDELNNCIGKLKDQRDRKSRYESVYKFSKEAIDSFVQSMKAKSEWSKMISDCSQYLYKQVLTEFNSPSDEFERKNAFMMVLFRHNFPPSTIQELLKEAKITLSVKECAQIVSQDMLECQQEPEQFQRRLWELGISVEDIEKIINPISSQKEILSEAMLSKARKDPNNCQDEVKQRLVNKQLGSMSHLV
ncbi:hypothetical protein FGO68_gene8337 [Halteria grandinella]|uniref:Uncharacterized protein n=1 Tax=Halteria grandinella TaxID=5974 RepID=A0A8J8NQF1_HALGN|nr:hypothetical protein FGO68_gene8337 [Halteria grandinella]